MISSDGNNIKTVSVLTDAIPLEAFNHKDLTGIDTTSVTLRSKSVVSPAPYLLNRNTVI